MSLGIVLTPYGKVPGGYPPAAIAYSRGGNGTFMCQYGQCDPQHNTRDQAGHYYDTPLGSPRPGLFARLKQRFALRGLGAIPTDFDIAKVRGYLPVNSGWVTTKQGYQTGPWLPPHGLYPDNPNRVVTPLNGLGYYYPDQVGYPSNAPIPGSNAASVEDVVATMVAHNDRLLALTIVSTAAVATSAILTVFRTLKLIRDDK